MRHLLLFVLTALVGSSATSAKNAGDLLKQYLDNPKKAVREEILAFVKIISVEYDMPPEGNWKCSGTIGLQTVEAVGGETPKIFTVRFFKRKDETEDAWTWDHVELTEGKMLLGFFNNWEKTWGVRKDGRTNVINNPSKIDRKLLARAQTLFNTPLRPEPKVRRNDK